MNCKIIMCEFESERAGIVCNDFLSLNLVLFAQKSTMKSEAKNKEK